MKKKMCGLIAMLLVVCMTLTGCVGLDFAGYFEQLLGVMLGGTQTDFSEMEYIRPDMEQLQKTVDDCCGKVAQATSLMAVVDIIYDAYEPIDAFSTAYALSNIYYSKDLTDAYWAEEYAFCSENATVTQAALDQFYRALAACDYREELEGDRYFGADFFEDYEGESIYDDTFQDLMAQEAALESRYYALCNEASAVEYYSEEFFTVYGTQMAELFVELIGLRQQIAAHLGYASYPEFAYEYYYGRDYTPQQTTAYLADIRAELVPMYRKMCLDGVDLQVEYAGENDTLLYVRKAVFAMGGELRDAYDTMVNYHLYDISYGENKYDASFEVYISGYFSPYLFVNPTQTDYDKLTVTHEFGHFACDYVNGGSNAGVDVAEVFSQGLEYLSLCYTENVGDLEKLKMVDCLSVMVEQAAYASFEQQVYDLTGDKLTVENVQTLFEQVGLAYGFDAWGFDSRSYVYITHFFTNPMYVISYVVSNDVALQLYQMEQAKAGDGLAAYMEALYSMDSGIVTFTQTYGLESPFADGRMTAIQKTLQAVLG